MAIKEIFESSTDKINLATQLLSELSDRAGQYVWKKFNGTSTTVSNPIIHLKQNGLNVDVTSTSVDVATLDSKFFDGFHLSAGTQYCFKYENGQLQYSNGTTWYPCSYDSAKHQIVFTSSGLDFNHDAVYEGSKTIVNFEKGTVTLHFTYSTTTTIKVTSSDTDLTKVDASYFAGVKTWYAEPSYPMVFVDSNQVAVGANGDIYTTYTYNPSTTTITLAKAISSQSMIYGDAVKFEYEGVSYVTADAEDAYPDGSELDGYLYERITSYTGANPLTIGENGTTIPANTILETALKILNGVQAGIPVPGIFSKYAVQTFTPTSRTKGNTYIKHGLSEIPRVVLAFAGRAITTDFNLIHFYLENWLQSTYQTGDLLYYYWYNGIERNDNTAFNINATQININSESPYYEAGVTYTIISFV